MTASAYQLFVFAVLAAPMIADLGLTRAQLGLVGSLNTLVGATTAPLTGRLTDAFGPRRSVVATLVFSALGMAVLASAPSIWWVCIASMLGGIPQGWGNPSTNALISSRVAPGRRGSLTGVKQSGVTLGVFLSGLTMPTIADVWGWRAAVWCFAALFVAFALAVQLLLHADDERPVRDRTAPRTRKQPLPAIIWWIALYAFVMGTAGGAVGRFFPLFAEESIGLSTAEAGLIVALGGLAGMAARVCAGRIAETRIRPLALLAVLACVGAAYCLLLAVVTPSTSLVLWFSPPINAVGIAAWNAVAMLAIIMFVASVDAGRASGVVMLGFLSGLAVSAPLAGLVVDHIGTYRPVWLSAAGLALGAAGLVVIVDRRDPTR